MSRLLHTLVLLLFFSKLVVSAPSCSLILKGVAPCLSYLQGQSATPECCKGVNELSGVAKTKDDRIAICNCVKVALASYKYDPKLIPLLHKECGADLELPPVDKDYDCSNA